MDIVLIPDKILKSKTADADVEDIKNGKYSELVSDMRKSMKDNNGVGLSANQINKNLTLFVIDKNLADNEDVPDAFFNGEITEYGKQTDEMEEGCLSIPGFYTSVRRAKKLKIKAVDENGNKIKIKARGFLARVFQHETDHLNGLTIKDRAIK